MTSLSDLPRFDHPVGEGVLDLPQSYPVGLSSAISNDRGGRFLVLLHGWGCDHSFLEPQFQHFASTMSVMAPDLPGHGVNPAEGNLTVRSMSEAVAELLIHLDVSDAIVVGHSMGGAVALDLTLVAPQTVGGLIMIDTALRPPTALTAAARGVIELLRQGRRKEAMDATVQALSIPTDDPGVLDRFRRSCDRLNADLLAASLSAHILDYDPGPAAAALRAPVAYIGAETPLCPFDTLRSLVPGVSTGQVVGSGHFAPLLVPEQVNAMIDRFAALIGRSR